MGRYVFDEDGIPTAVQTQTGTTYTATTSESVIDSNYYEFKDDTESQSVKGETYNNTKAKDLKGFIESTLNNGGYYIARYEAGISGTADNNNMGKKTEVNGSIKPLLQSGKSIWNAITQPDAATVCQNMYDSINSDLVNSYAWDTAIVFIQNFGTKANSASYSRTKGKSTTGKIAKTGTNLLNETNLKDEQCNIYDMAGNVAEWTTETLPNNSWGPCTKRSGSFDSNSYTTYRIYGTISHHGNSLGFRPILYIK